MRVLTLNLAHGRGRALHQAVLRKKQIEANLDRAAAVIVRESPDVVALQEIDEPSAWSGRIDHVERIARHVGMSYAVRGTHNRRRWGAYGTVLLARRPFTEGLSVTFPHTPPTPAKGFVLGRVPLPDGQGWVDVVSIHLDFLRRRVRLAQVQQLVATLGRRSGPRILMGDFNCPWRGRDPSLRVLTAALDLAGFDCAVPGHCTFPLLRRRLDWVFASRGLRFVDYRTLPDRISDHRAVVAELAWDSAAEERPA